MLPFVTLSCIAGAQVGPAVDVFVGGRDGYHTFRIPAVVRAADGSLLAFAEGRRAGRGDAGDIDLVCRRSTDGGEHWGELQLVADFGDGIVGNPVPIVDAPSGDVVVVATLQPGGCNEADIRAGRKGWRKPCVLRSSDHGVTWSESSPLPVFEPDGAGWRWYATGPGHGVQLRSGPHAGRLIVPANHSLPGGGADRWLGAHLLLSDDGGRTWRVGAVDDSHVGHGELNLNESTAAEFWDELVVSARDQHGSSPANRARARSLDGGETFAAPFVPNDDLRGPVCQGSLLSAGERDGVWRLLFSGPFDTKARRDLRVFASSDGGFNWLVAAELHPGAAAYSDLVVLGEDAFGCLFEADDSARIVFRRFSVAWDHPHVSADAIEPVVEPEPERGFVAPPPEGRRHRVVDTGMLHRAFPLRHFQGRGCRGRGRIVSSPADLAMVEGVRDAVGRAALGRAVSVDVFLWARGAPEQPWLTRIGGLPHRERAAPWPTRAEGKPMTFLAQWCFADSHDVVGGELPGEVLLMFVAEPWPWQEKDDAGRPQIVLEWSARTLREPMTRADVPQPGFAVPELHGVRHRTVQYPDVHWTEEQPDPFTAAGFSEQSYLLGSLQATVIGPSAHAIQGHEPRRGERLLCTLSSVQPNLVWPLLDCRHDARGGSRRSPHELMLDDVGCYYVWIDRRGRLRVLLSCY